MSIASLTMLGLKASIVIIVFAFGLRATLSDSIELLRRRGLLVRSLLSLNVVMFGVAILLVQIFAPPFPARVAILALSVSPIPPLLPHKLAGVQGATPYMASLIVFAALLAIGLIPLSVELMGAYFAREVHAPPARIVPVVTLMILVPLLLGMLVNRFFPAFANRFAHPINLLGTIILLVGAVIVLIAEWRPLYATVGSGIILVVTLFAVIGLIVGHLLGGPEPANREVLAMATSVRHPGLALTIASINYPDEKSVLQIVLWYVLIGFGIAIAYKSLLALASKSGS